MVLLAACGSFLCFLFTKRVGVVFFFLDIPMLPHARAFNVAATMRRNGYVPKRRDKYYVIYKSYVICIVFYRSCTDVYELKSDFNLIFLIEESAVIRDLHDRLYRHLFEMLYSLHCRNIGSCAFSNDTFKRQRHWIHFVTFKME